jgi:RNA polymerase sigma-70 factor, ECF subfamily
LEDSDADLARRAGRGDQKALHALVDRHGPQLLAMAYSLTGQVADAEDLVQETFLAGMAGFKRFEGRSSVKTWLVSILVRQVAAWRRRSGVRKTQELMEDLPVAETGAGADARMDVAAALPTLTPEYREVLVLREFGGLSYEEIASALGLPRGTVESRLHRARLEMRDRLKGYGT